MTNILPKLTSPRRTKILPLVLTCAVLAGFAASIWLAAASSAGAQEEKPVDEPKKEKKRDELSPEEKATQKQALEIISQAREHLESFTSLRAQLLETVLIGSRRFRSEGSYLQGPNRQIKLEFNLSVKGIDGKPVEGSLLQVSDGNILQTSYQVGEEIRVTRRDLTQILEAIAEYPSIESELQIARLGLGGIPALLASIEKAMRFTDVKTEEIREVKYIVISGSWSKTYLNLFGVPDHSKLPEFIPDSVKLYLDEQSLLPRRVLYLKTVEGKMHPMISVDFTEIKTNVPLTTEDFFFVAPEGVVPLDITPETIQMVRASAKADKERQEKKKKQTSDSEKE